MNRIRPKLTYANVVSTLALIAAVGGGTTAIAISGKVGAKELDKIKVRQAFSPENVQVVDTRAQCKKGERLIGGGAEMRIDRLLASFPDGNGWRARGSSLASSTGSGSAYALCLSK